MNRFVVFTVLLFVSSMTVFAWKEDSSDYEGREMEVRNAYHERMSRNVFGEFFGPSFGVGVGFDSRFRPGTVFGYRVGLSFTDGSFGDASDWHSADFTGLCVPLEINAIFGHGKSRFELGIGATPAILHRIETDGKWVSGGEGELYPAFTTSRHNRLNILGTLNIGYRYQRERGFFMRVGLTVYAGDLDYSPIDGVWLLPNLSLGYTFKY